MTANIIFYHRNKSNQECNLIVSHIECTDCLDLQVDSGEVKIPKYIGKQFHVIKLKNGFLKKEPNLTDLTLNDTVIFSRLRREYKKGQIGEETQYRDFSFKYRVKGFVTGFDKNGHTIFQINEYFRLDTIYSNQFE